MKNSKPSPLEQEDQSAEQEQSFLRRWSKRKLEAPAAIEERANDAIELQPFSERPQETGSSNSNTPDNQSPLELTDEDMPSVESLDENSDYTGFLSPKVSETLRRQALRKLFHFQQFNITDGLDDYDDDFTNFEKLGDVVTHEMKRLLQREAEKLHATVTENQNYQDAIAQNVNPTENTIANSEQNVTPSEAVDNLERNTELEEASSELLATDSIGTQT